MPFWLAAGLGLAAGALAGAWAWRWRGAGHLGAGRILCALLASLPVAVQPFPWGLAAYLPAAALAWAALTLPHDPNPQGWRGAAGAAWSGFLFVAPPALVLALAFDRELAGGLLLLAGAGKAACYRLPRGPAPDLKFLWRELAFGALWGGTAGAILCSTW